MLYSKWGQILRMNKEWMIKTTKRSVHTGWSVGYTRSIIRPVSQWQLWATASSQLLFLLLLPGLFLLLFTLPLLCMFCKQLTNIRLLLLLLLRLIFIHLAKHHKNTPFNSTRIYLVCEKPSDIWQQDLANILFGNLDSVSKSLLTKLKHDGK